MTSVIAAMSFGGEWHIHDKDAIQTSFPSFKNCEYVFLNEEKKIYKNCNRPSLARSWNF